MTDSRTAVDIATELIAPERLEQLDLSAPILALPGRTSSPENRRFEGLYGRVYNRVIQNRRLRTAAFSAWGSADPLYDLEGFINDAAAAVSTTPSPVVVDLPCGGGTLLPFLSRAGFSGTVVEIDLALEMLQRSVETHKVTAPAFAVVFLQGDALDLPLKHGAADLVISVNGLHVVPDHGRFLAEVARTLRPGGKLWLITPVDGTSRRSRFILAAARKLNVTPQAPPTRERLLALLDDAGFGSVRSYGGNSITGLSCAKTDD